MGHCSTYPAGIKGRSPNWAGVSLSRPVPARIKGLDQGRVGKFREQPAGEVMASMPNGGLHSDPFVIVEVAPALASVGIFACWLPARRASGLDPVRAIRYE